MKKKTNTYIYIYIYRMLIWYEFIYTYVYILYYYIYTPTTTSYAQSALTEKIHHIRCAYSESRSRSSHCEAAVPDCPFHQTEVMRFQVAW